LKAIFSILFLVLFYSLPAAACTMQKDRAADVEVYSLKTWDSLYSMYQKYGDCGLTGDTAEIFSDEVEKLFSNDWKDVDELAKLSRWDKQFEDFVLNHIDETWDSDTTRLKENARKHCPTRAAALCRRIKARIEAVDKAIEEEKSNAYDQW
jgi:hypothetical protein